MRTEFLLTVTGRDQRGLLHRISGIAVEHHATMLKSKLVHLEGGLAGLIKMSVDQEHGNALKNALLDAEGIEIKIHTLAADDMPQQGIYRLVIDAKDRANIINELSQVLSANHVDILHVETQRLAVAEFGDTVFTGQFDLSIPQDVDAEDLKHQLRQLQCAPSVHLAEHQS